ncbi:MAG: class IV adenylate cyclase [Promethearchaeota archaeon]
MVIEVEIKVRLPDRDAVVREILSMGGRFKGCLLQEDAYFDKPAGQPSFWKTDEALRLRVTRELEGSDFDPTTRKVRRVVPDITYKGPKLEEKTKTRAEMRVVIGDAGTMREILAALGFREVIVLEKERETYEVEWRGRDVEVTLDRIQQLPGEFMELEVIAETDGEMVPARDQLLEFLAALGFSESDSIRESYLELVFEQLGKGT